MALSSDERQACFRAAERFLGGHGRRAPRAVAEGLIETLGDGELADVYGEGEALARFERDMAERLGHVAAVFMPSGTMAQPIALRLWAERRPGAAVAFHPTCHLELHEHNAYHALHGLRARLVGERTRLIRRADLDAIAEPIAALLLELPQREIGGQLPTWDELGEQLAWAREHQVAVHLDGARLWEAQPYYARSLAEIAGRFDSVYVSFYKILGGIAGAVLAGPADFVAQARVWMRRQGGNLVTQWPFVVAARAGLRDHLPRVPAYVARAREIARVLAALPGVRVTPDPPPTNMMHVALPGDADALLDAAAQIAREERVALFTRVRACDVPGYVVVELAIGEAAFALGDDELGTLLTRVLAAGAGGATQS